MMATDADDIKPFELTRYYEKGPMLGEGEYGKVYIWHKLPLSVGEEPSLPTEIAVKELMEPKKIYGFKRKGYVQFQNFNNLVKFREFYSHLGLGEHDNIVGILGGAVEGTRGYIVMEKCDSNLEDLLLHKNRKFDPFESAVILDQCLRGLNRMHETRHMHRDIKPSNILIKALEKKFDLKVDPVYTFLFMLSDFGFSRPYPALEPDEIGTFSVKGTPMFFPPELRKALREERPAAQYLETADLFTFGILAYIVFTGNWEIGFIDDNGNVDTRGLEQELKEHKDFLDFLLCILREDMLTRTSARDLLRHPFILNARRQQESELLKLVNGAESFFSTKTELLGQAKSDAISCDLPHHDFQKEQGLEREDALTMHLLAHLDQTSLTQFTQFTSEAVNEVENLRKAKALARTLKSDENYRRSFEDDQALREECRLLREKYKKLEDIWKEIKEELEKKNAYCQEIISKKRDLEAKLQDAQKTISNHRMIELIFDEPRRKKTRGRRTSMGRWSEVMLHENMPSPMVVEDEVIGGSTWTISRHCGSHRDTDTEMTEVERRRSPSNSYMTETQSSLARRQPSLLSLGGSQHNKSQLSLNRSNLHLDTVGRQAKDIYLSKSKDRQRSILSKLIGERSKIWANVEEKLDKSYDDMKRTIILLDTHSQQKFVGLYQCNSDSKPNEMLKLFGRGFPPTVHTSDCDRFYKFVNIKTNARNELNGGFSSEADAFTLPLIMWNKLLRPKSKFICPTFNTRDKRLRNSTGL